MEELLLVMELSDNNKKKILYTFDSLHSHTWRWMELCKHIYVGLFIINVRDKGR